MLIPTKIRPLIKAVPLAPLPGFERVENSAAFIYRFRTLYSKYVGQNVLYNHSPIYPFSYLNKGQFKLYLNKPDYHGYFNSEMMLPIVKKFETKPFYFLHFPMDMGENILEVVKKLDCISNRPVTITDVTESYAEVWCIQYPEWEAVKTSTDVIQDTEILTKLSGRNFSSLRNTLKHVRNDLCPRIEVLSAVNKTAAIQVFRDWKEKQGKKYFRVTIGRDVRLIEEYYDKIDGENFFSFVHFVSNRPVACSFGCRSYADAEWGIDVTCKADVDCRGLGDFAFVHLMQEMWKKGIRYVNDSGYYGTKIKQNKLKFQPVATIPMFDLRRKLK